MLSLPINHYFGGQTYPPMVTTWNTENLGGTGSATKVLLLPFADEGRVVVDWGDGTINRSNTHTYASGGVKTVKLYGEVRNWVFDDLGDKLKITNVSDVGGWRPRSGGFRGCSNLTWTATGALNNNTSTTFNSLFRGCTLFNGDVSSWDVSNITNLSGTFRDCVAFNQAVGSWNVTTATTNINSLFYGCTIFNQDISGWDVSNVTTFASAFRDCAALNPNIGGWNVTSTTTAINNMCRGSLFNRDISGWDISAVTNASNFANGSSFSTTNYDLLLPAWEAQSVQDNVSFHAGSATYGAGSPAAARAALIADHTWTITDGGPT